MSRKLNISCGPSSTLSKILDTPVSGLETIYDIDLSCIKLRSTEKSVETNPHLHSKGLFEGDINLQNVKMLAQDDEVCENIEAAVKKLSLASTPASVEEHYSPFAALLAICGQSAPSKLQDVFSKYWCVPCSLVPLYLKMWVSMISKNLVLVNLHFIPHCIILNILCCFSL